ncbi:MAG TPA: SdpI family protein [Ktedonobacteraceae bacterium]|nr:SdpI family protein [Ktedonobacteraceae bacterium]
MSLSNDTRDKISPAPLLRDPMNILALAIIALQILIAIIAFPFLPAVVPTHWNAAGQVNGHASKWVNTLLFPLLSVGIYLLIRFVAAASPRLVSRSSSAANTQVRTVVLVAVLLFELIVQLCVTAISLGMRLDIPFTLNLAMAVLFIVIGNFMGKLRRNFWMGIRTPWTLTSEVVWERTHRLGGWLFVAVGLIGIPCSFVPALRIWAIVALTVLVAIVLCVYSYVCYCEHTRGDDESVSPPFNGASEE